MRPARCFAIYSLLIMGIGCTDDGIQPIDNQGPLVVDDLLTISGEVCTKPPTDQVFPVKIMFIVDTSGSMQFTDPSDKAGDAKAACSATCMTLGTYTQAECDDNICANANNPGRQAAVDKVVQRFKNNPTVSFAIIAFNGRIRDTEVFTRDEAKIQEAMGWLKTADITTDYQGALSKAYQILEKDMLDAEPIDRGRTKYVIMFLSDGGPNPVCKEGCDNDEILFADLGITLDSWCDLPREQWNSNFNAPAELEMENWYPAMVEPCRAYNTEQDISKKVTEIMNLGTQYGVGDIRLHTAFLFVDSLPKAIRDLFYDQTLSGDEQKAGAESLLKKMAKSGEGLYRSFNTGQQIDFLDINYTSIARPFGITNFTVTNTNALPGLTGLLVDTDGDGVDDKTEFEAHLDMDDLSRDSDGDGYNDKLEYDRRSIGFHPGDPKVPARRCRESERVDRDGDGLLDCEEAILGTEPKVADTDRDRIPDGLEFLFGTDPTKADAKEDQDFDGKLADHEINTHTNPMVVDPELQANYRYIYDVKEQGARPDLRKCYDFNVRRVRLVTTKQAGGAGSLGYNEILVYFGEGPADDPRDTGSFKTACVRAQYVEPSYKFPASGHVRLTPANFYDLPELLKRMAAAKADSSQEDPCVGAPLP